MDKKFGQDLEDLKSENKISIVEINEMHTYIGNKKYCWIWIDVDRVGKNSSTALLAVEEQKWTKTLG